AELIEEAYLLERTSQRQACETCGGTGLDAKYDAVTLGGRTPRAVHALPVVELRRMLEELAQGSLGRNPAFGRVLDEMLPSLARIEEVGLGYLNIARRVRSLSAGEAQRLKLAGILGENLRGVLYVLD